MSDKSYTVERSFQLNADGALNFLRIYTERQAWINVLYLLMAFPLGIAYFVFLVTGTALGLGLSITLVGIPLLVLVFFGTGWLAQFDGWLAKHMIGASIPRMYRESSEEGWLTRILSAFRDVNRWKAFVYLLMRFPLGIAGFVAAVVSMSIPFAMITAPFHYSDSHMQIAAWHINTFGEAIAASILGIFIGAISLHIVGGIVSIWRALMVGMLGEFDSSDKRKNEEKRKNDDLHHA